MASEQVRKANRSTRNLWLRRSIWSVIAVGVVGSIAYAVRPKPLDVEVATAEQKTLVVTVDEDGKARVKDRFVVSAPLTANLARIELHVGDAVTPGTVLARLVPIPSPLLDQRSRSQAEAQVAVASAANHQAQAQIDRAKAAVELSHGEAERTRTLFANGTVTRSALDRAELDERGRNAELASAQFAAKVATHQLREAQAALGRYDAAKPSETWTVTSPIEGQVLSILQKSEGVVQAGAPLLELGDPKALEIVADVLTRDAVAVNPSAHAEILDWGGPPLEARVRLVEPSGFTRMSALGVEEQRVNVVLDLLSPFTTWAKLGDGYRTSVRIETFRAENVLAVPQSALFRNNRSWATYVVRQGTVALQPVEVGHRDKSHAEIVTGLQVGDQVIVHPSAKVAPGVEVAAKP